MIDDRQPARAAWLDIAFDGRLDVTILRVQPIRPGPGLDARLVTAADLEAVVALPDGSFVAAEEGHRSTGAAGQPPAGEWPAALLTLSPQLRVTRMDAWPSSFDLGADAGGIRDNQGVESLTRTPDGRLVAGLEQPRYRDMSAASRNGRPFAGGRGGPGRLVEFVTIAGEWRARRQWLYPIAPTPARNGFDAICDDGENGLTDLLALDDTTFLSLERACLLRADSREVRNTAGIHHVDVSMADDVSGLDLLTPGAARAVAKTLILDLDAVIPRLPASLARLENFEALAFGPTLPNGDRTIIALSDDNFRPTQQTVFLIFRLAGLR